MEEAQRPLPVPSPETMPYWEGCRRHELLMQRCSDCGTYQFFPRVMCHKCLSSKVEWLKVSGKGEVYTFSVVHRPPSPWFADKVPYAVAQIRLAEGPQMISQVVSCPVDEVFMGMPVEVVFEDVSETISLPMFRPQR